MVLSVFNNLKSVKLIERFFFFLGNENGEAFSKQEESRQSSTLIFPFQSSSLKSCLLSYF